MILLQMVYGLIIEDRLNMKKKTASDTLMGRILSAERQHRSIRRIR